MRSAPEAVVSGGLSQGDLASLRGRVLLLDVAVVLNVMLLTDGFIAPSCFALVVLLLWREQVVRGVYRAGTRVLVELGSPVRFRLLMQQSLEAIALTPATAAGATAPQTQALRQNPRAIDHVRTRPDSPSEGFAAPNAQTARDPSFEGSSARLVP